MEDIQKIISRMDPEDALATIASAIRGLFAQVSEEVRLDFVVNLIGEADADKVASLVQLWLAECMGEGVDPTKMCQSMVDKVARSKQLRSVTDPDLLILFEDWLDELEGEVATYLQSHPGSGAAELMENLGLSHSGATFLIAKLKQERKI